MSAVALLVACGEKVFVGPFDYQESGEFRWIIGNRLSDLLGVSTGGHTYSKSGYRTDSTGARYKYMDESYEEWEDRFLNEASDVQEAVPVEQPDVEQSAVESDASEYELTLDDFGGSMDEYLAYLEGLRARQYEQMLDEYGLAAGGYAWADGNGSYTYYGSDSYLYADEKSYMADMAKDLNIRYAVIYQNKLLYSNIEGYEEKAGEAWSGEDFAKALDAKAYNFTLWYNKEGDGKVEIVKDGRKEDVYGDGLYTDASRWRVPGYANYQLGDKAKEAVIFLAAAKDPQRYLVYNETGSGYASYGGELYRLKTNTVYLQYQAEQTRKFLGAAAVLLLIAFLLRKSRKPAAARIAGFLGKLCLEAKLVLFVILFITVIVKGGGAFSEAVWYLGSAGLYNWDVGLGGDIAWQFTRIALSGIYLAFLFWLFYLAALDVRYNGKTQKKPLINLLKIKDLKYPIQKRLVRRQRWTLIAELALLALFAAAFGLYALFVENPGTVDMISDAVLEQVTATTVVENAAEYGLSAWSVGMPFLLVMEVTFAVLAVFTVLTAWDLKKNRRLAMDIGALTDQILAVREGNLTEELTLSEETDLREAADNLNQIQKGMEKALTEQVKSERMKVDLVTNVSHDIKTPLTSIISYAELLRQEEELPRHVKEYIQILGEKAERLRGIVQDVFEISKATSGQLPIKMETLDMGKLLRQTLADMNDRMETSGLAMRITIPETPVSVMADGQRLYRVFQNLLQNALRYSLPGSRVYLALTEETGRAVVRIKNTSGVELAGGTDFTERFVRGDESRTDGGSGLGLSIAKSFTQACGGSLTVETDADLFTVTVSFPMSGQGTAAPFVYEEEA